MKRLHFWLLWLAIIVILFASDLTSGNRIMDAAKSKVFDLAVKACEVFEQMKASQVDTEAHEFTRDIDKHSKSNIPRQRKTRDIEKHVEADLRSSK